ncbi:MAG: hypothetical protein ACFCUQ_12300 [Kiloniellales bacterium]
MAGKIDEKIARAAPNPKPSLTIAVQNLCQPLDVSPLHRLSTMKTLRNKSASRHAGPSRRAERRSFAVLALLAAAIWFASTLAVQYSV